MVTTTELCEDTKAGIKEAEIKKRETENQIKQKEEATEQRTAGASSRQSRERAETRSKAALLEHPSLATAPDALERPVTPGTTAITAPSSVTKRRLAAGAAVKPEERRARRTCAQATIQAALANGRRSAAGARPRVTPAARRRRFAPTKENYGNETAGMRFSTNKAR